MTRNNQAKIYSSVEIASCLAAVATLDWTGMLTLIHVGEY
jgi:hypothetical protein